ncbi:DUF5681 domain-containing protein [Sphingomonas sp. MMS24-J13]|uniref:DUF5681 domain-containing protein n=1 Tax=Sphingomonas sp. MMS24-J13 TaxID=3238686 RepID=UPI0038511625
MTPTPAYEVGHCRPPVETRFQPGRSGNPRGRPRKPRRDYRGTYGAAWLDDVVLDEVYRHVPIEEDGRTFYLTTLQAAVRAIGAAAAKGSRLHARLLFELTDRIETRRAAQRTAILDEALHAKTGWAELRALAEQQAQPLPDPPHPHPDTLRIDPRTGLVATDDALWDGAPPVADHADPAQPHAEPAAPPAVAPTPAEATTDTLAEPVAQAGAPSVECIPFAPSEAEAPPQPAPTPPSLKGWRAPNAAPRAPAKPRPTRPTQHPRRPLPPARRTPSTPKPRPPEPSRPASPSPRCALCSPTTAAGTAQPPNASPISNPNRRHPRRRRGHGPTIARRKRRRSCASWTRCIEADGRAGAPRACVDQRPALAALLMRTEPKQRSAWVAGARERLVVNP